jgi:hypothetical protein
MILADLGNIGEFVASIGVLVTLIYLAIQIRQNTATTQVQIRQAIADSQFANINSRATDAQLPMIIMKANRGEPLTEEEEYRLYFHLDATMRQFENIHSQYVAGVLPEKDWAAISTGMMRTLRSSSVRGIWSGMRDAYNVDFSATVDKILSSPENAESPSHTSESSAGEPTETDQPMTTAKE